MRPLYSKEGFPYNRKEGFPPNWSSRIVSSQRANLNLRKSVGFRPCKSTGHAADPGSPADIWTWISMPRTADALNATALISATMPPPAFMPAHGGRRSAARHVRDRLLSSVPVVIEEAGGERLRKAPLDCPQVVSRRHRVRRPSYSSLSCRLRATSSSSRHTRILCNRSTTLGRRASTYLHTAP